MIAHLAGVPLEELLPVLASGGAAMAVAVNAALRNVVRRRRRRRPSHDRDHKPLAEPGDLG
jgi:hypothetical protein